MSSSDTLVKPLSTSSKFKPRASAPIPATPPPTAPMIPVESGPRTSQAPLPRISPAERSFRRLLLADAALSVACSVAAVLALPDFPPAQAAWLGFVSANFMLWTGVAITGACLILRDGIAGLQAPQRPDVPAGAKAKSPQPVRNEFTSH